MLITSMNSSPSSFFFDDPKNTSSEIEIQWYMDKISGPLLKCIDLNTKKKLNNCPTREMVKRVRSSKLEY